MPELTDIPEFDAKAEQSEVDDLAASILGGKALQFDDSKGHHVYAGKFWELAADASYGDFYYDWLAKPFLSAEYVFSAGYGGAHAFLGGYNGGASGRIGVTGNVSTAAGGSVDVNFTSGSDQAFIDHWGHVGIGRFANTITIYMNGVASKRFTKATNRGSLVDSDLGLYIGGSDHSNFNGQLAWVRVFENNQPFYSTPADGGVLRVSPRPTATYWEAVSETFKTANILLDFSHYQAVITNHGTPLTAGDLGHGYRNAGTNPGIFQAFQGFAESALPQWVALDAPISKPNYGLTPTTPPGGVKIFDSFKRDDVVYLWQNILGLGSTEAGSLGVKTWDETNFGTVSFGILFGRVFSAATGADTVRTHVTNDSPYMKVEVKNNGNETEGAVLFAAYDFVADTGIKASHLAGDTITLYKVVAGAPTSLGNYVIPGTNASYTLGIEYTSTRQVKLLIDGTPQVTFDDSGSSALTGVRAGLSAITSYVRFEDFAVYAASA